MNSEVLDFTALANTIKRMFSTKDDRESFPIQESDFLFLLKEEKIPCPGKEDFFFCPVFLSDKKEDRSYPVFFLPSVIEDNGKLLSVREDSYPIYSMVLDEFLKNISANLSLEHRLSDIPAYLFSLRTFIESSGALKDRLFLEYKVAFYSQKEMLYHSIYRSLPKYSSPDSASMKYHGFLKKNSDTETEKKLKEDDKKYFSPLLKTWDSLSGYGVGKVSYTKERDRNMFLLYMLSKWIPEGKKVLIVSEDKQDVRSLLERHHLTDFTFDFSSFYATEISFSPFHERTEKDYTEAIERKRRLNQARSDYLNLVMQKQALYTPPLLEEDLQNLLYQSQFEGISPFPLDLSDYGEEDFKKDLEFVKNMGQYQTILSVPLMKNPLYGLSLSGKKENYDLLVLCVTETYSKLNAFLSYLQERKITSVSGDKIEKGSEFLELGKDIEVLNEYNGFPKRYFKIENPEDPNMRLEDLKTLYRAVSSSRLMVDNLFDEKIYQQDIDRLTQEYESGFFGRINARKKMKSYLKNSKNADYGLFIRILKHYRKAVLLLNEALPKYQEIYGDSVLNMNGLIEIESNIKYLKKFRMRGKFNPSFTIDNPKIKKAIREKEYRQDMILDYQTAKEKYDEYISSLNRYIGFFIDSRKDYSHMDFVDVQNELNRRQNITYPMFRDYSQFKKELENTSMNLQLKVREATLGNRSLSLFRNQYLLSLYHAIYLDAEKESKKLEKPLEEAQKSYFEQLKQLPYIKEEMLYRDFDEIIEKETKDEKNIETLASVMQHYHEGTFTIEDIQKSYELYEKTHPLCIASSPDLGYSYSDQFDVVVLMNTKCIDTLSLFGCMDCGKEALIVNSQKESDARLQGYEEIPITNEDMYLSRFHFNRVPNDFVEYMKGKAPLFGYDFIVDDPRFKWILVDRNNPKRQFAVVPDASVSSNLMKETLTQFREYLYVHFGLYMIDFVVFEALFEKERFLKESLKLFES